jgi:polysaccharide deacetylase family protein (PEP-CTERM system associated)
MIVEPLRFEAAPSVVTIDLEEWFCVCGDDYYSDLRQWDRFESRIESSASVLIDLLAASERRATFFVLGWIARKYPGLIRRIASEGHEIAFHGMSHRRCDEMTRSDLRRELCEGRALLEDLTGARVIGFRAPEWSIRSVTDPALETLAESGFRYDASMTAIPILGRRENPRHPVAVATEKGRIVEFPPLTGRGWGHTVNVGGGWAFRRLSWERVMAQADRFRCEGAPAIFTFHPWEFDADAPPLMGASALVRLTRQAHRGRTRRRFGRLLEAGSTSRLGDLL